MTCWHGSEQPLPTHDHASTLHVWTYMLGDPRVLAGAGGDDPTPPRTIGPRQQHWEAQLHTQTWGSAWGGQARHSTALPHKCCPKYQPREEERRQHSPMFFKGLLSLRPALCPAEWEILTGGTGK